MREPVVAYVGLGANLGDARTALDGAVRSLRLAPGVTVTAQSSQYQSAPIDSSGPDYINSVVEVRTELTAPALLACLHAIENAAGRERPFQNAPRTLDLDLLLLVMPASAARC
jgi:2-amino-4-hydroxy-6-hydroxymethyldihydropteridine diphosphokinase